MAAFYLYPKFKTNSHQDELFTEIKPIAECDGLSNADYRMECYIRKAKENGDQSICDNIISKFHKDICYTEISETMPDKAICQKISDGSRERCYFNVAIAKSDSSQCASFKTLSNDCFNSIGLQTKDAKLCEQITSSDFTKYSCLAVVTKDPKICNNIGLGVLTQRGLCYTRVAVASQSPAICGAQEVWDKAGCYISVAQETKNANLCSKADYRSDECYYLLGQINLDVKICEKIKDATQQEGCRQQIATRLGDLSTCENIKDQYIRDSCYSEIASKSKNIAVCDRVEEKNSRDFCYLDFIRRAKEIIIRDPSICEKIQRDDIRKECYQAIK